jgi:autotransporter-associated beta strand protein
MSISANIVQTSPGDKGIRKEGPGTLELSGASTYGGDTHIDEGTVIVSGSITGSTVFVVGTLNLNGSITTDDTVIVHGLISGAGSILAPQPEDAAERGKLTVSPIGTASPGSTLNGENSTATLTANYLETITGATLKIELGGTNAGTPVNGYDQIATNHRISLATNTTLTLSLAGGYAPNATGDKYFIIVNSGIGAATTGTFAGTTPTMYPFSSETFNVITTGGLDFAVSYDANSIMGTFHGGNDVALMSVPEPNSLSMLAGSLGLALGLQRFRRRRS